MTPVAPQPAPYDALTPRGQVRRLLPYAKAALSQYGLEESRLRFIHHGENTVFRVEAAFRPADWEPHPGLHPTRCLLRIHRTTYNWPEEIRSELLWTQALRRDTGMATPVGLTPRSLSALHPISDPAIGGERVITLTRWVTGRCRDRDPRPGDFELIGELLAQLHNHASEWHPPAGFTRPHFHERGLAMPNGNSDRGCGDVWHLVPSEARPIFRKVRTRMLRAVASIGEGPETYGLIHGDLHLHNVVFANGRALPIDFDDCLYGHWLFDFAVASQPYPGSAEPMLRGYRRVRPFPDSWVKSLRVLQVGRTVGTMLWLFARAQTNQRFVPIVSRALPRVLAGCHEILGTTRPTE